MSTLENCGGAKIWTVGHSTRGLDEFTVMLSAYGVEAVADVRRFPASRKYPHFNQEHLSASLSSVGVEYLHIPELGGRRRPCPGSHNTVWRNEPFRGYADHMETEQFRSGIESLMETARRKSTVVMCSEAVWWRCHMALLADFLKARGVDVKHILSREKSSDHPYTSAARVTGEGLSYAADNE